LLFCNRKLMRTDIFFTRTTKSICNFVNPGLIGYCLTSSEWHFSNLIGYYLASSELFFSTFLIGYCLTSSEWYFSNLIGYYLTSSEWYLSNLIGYYLMSSEWYFSNFEEENSDSRCMLNYILFFCLHTDKTF
jgi:hypothetical protein